MKGIVSLLFAVLLSVPVLAQSAVKKEAEKMGAALLSKDYIRFTDFSYPKIVKEMGGKQKMAAAIGQQMSGMERQGNKITSLSFGEPSAIIKEGKELQCTIPQIMEIKVAAGNVKTTSTLIAISTDNGMHWYFVDAGDRDLNAVRKSLPNISKKIVLPKPEAPQFTP